MINCTLLLSESESSLIEHIRSEEADILGHKEAMTTDHVFLGDSAGDQNDTYIQLHKQNKQQPQMRWWSCYRDRQKYHLQRLVTPYTRKSSRRTRDGVCASRVLAIRGVCTQCIHKQLQQEKEVLRTFLIIAPRSYCKKATCHHHHRW
jgi:hypothetical protein